MRDLAWQIRVVAWLARGAARLVDGSQGVAPRLLLPELRCPGPGNPPLLTLGAREVAPSV